MEQVSLYMNIKKDSEKAENLFKKIYSELKSISHKLEENEECAVFAIESDFGIEYFQTAEMLEEINDLNNGSWAVIVADTDYGLCGRYKCCGAYEFQEISIEKIPPNASFGTGACCEAEAEFSADVLEKIGISTDEAENFPIEKLFGNGEYEFEIDGCDVSGDSVSLTFGISNFNGFDISEMQRFADDFNKFSDYLKSIDENAVLNLSDEFTEFLDSEHFAVLSLKINDSRINGFTVKMPKKK